MGTFVERLAYSPTELARLMEVSRPTVYSWLKIDGFPVVRIGGVTRIPAKAFEEWLNAQTGVSEGAR